MATGTTNLSGLIAGTTTLGATTLGNTMAGDITAQNATTSSLSTGNLFANMFSGLTSYFTSLSFVTANGQNLLSTNIFSENITATGTVTFTNIMGTNATITNLNTNKLTSDGLTLTIGSLSNDFVSFIQNGAEVMRLKTTGDVEIKNSLAIGGASLAYQLHVGSSTSATGTVARFENIDGNCNINPSGAGFTCTSDERLKKNFTDYSHDVLAQLKNVSVKEYNMLRQADGTPKQVGYIAQNLEKIFPWLVVTDEEGFKSVSYSNMTPMLVLAINKMNLKIDLLLEKIENGFDVLIANKIKTKELCVGEVCFTESEMKEFRNYLNSKKEISPVIDVINSEPLIPVSSTTASEVVETTSSIVDPVTVTETIITN
jgi:Chaperone of endosialidase